MPAADYQLFAVIMRAAAKNDSRRAVGAFLKSLYFVDRNERATMNTDKRVGKLLLEGLE